jgi:hypothetical protein
MPKRSVKIVAATFASILASTLFGPQSRGETVAPDNCLLSPKGETPQGSHWHYRLEHGTKRQCWYLRSSKGEKLAAQAPAQNSVPVQNAAPSQSTAPSQNVAPHPNPPAPPVLDTTIQRSPADARAELLAQANGNDRQAADPAPIAAEPIRRANTSVANTPAVNAAVISARWPEPTTAVAPAAPTAPKPVDNNPASNIPPGSIPSVAPADAAETVVAEDSSPYRVRGIMPLLVAILGALTLATAIVVRFGRPRRPQPRKIRVRRGPIWETTDDDRIVLSDHPGHGAHMRQPQFARNVIELDERKSEAYRRNSRRAPA